VDVINEYCCGLDVHKKTVVACVIVPDAKGEPAKHQRTYRTMYDDLLALRTWLRELGVTYVAMESTGVYWKPVYNVLEGDFEQILLVNAQHVKAVPGRKTDMKDSEWLADLLRHGLLRGSFVPDREQRQTRDLTRYRTTLVRQRADEVNRLQKTLEGANIKLAAVASNVVGASGREILHALLAGATDTAGLAQLAKGRLRDKLADLERSLAGRFGAHECFMVAQHLALIDALDAAIDRLDEEVAARMRPFQPILNRLDTIPGISQRIAQVIVAEIGTDMSRFPTFRHLAKWAGLCPGNHESAGKQRTGRTSPGNPWLRAALVQAAQAAGRSLSYLAAQFHRLAARRGKKRAAVAVAHSQLVIAYHLIKESTDYIDLGRNYFDERNREGIKNMLVRRLQNLGYEVDVHTKAA
jgi:transposase